MIAPHVLFGYGRQYSTARVSKRLTDETAAQQSRAALYQPRSK
jgi:hypothetical protein